MSLDGDDIGASQEVNDVLDTQEGGVTELDSDWSAKIFSPGHLTRLFWASVPAAMPKRMIYAKQPSDQPVVGEASNDGARHSLEPFESENVRTRHRPSSIVVTILYYFGCTAALVGIVFVVVYLVLRQYGIKIL